MRKKSIKWVISVIPISLLVVFATCSDTLGYTEMGSEAAVEFCECYKKNSEEKCLENLKDKYKEYQYTSDNFIKGFNETSTCNIELTKIPVKSASFRMENKQDSIFLIINN
jgi:hypothetical protein